MSSCPTVLKWSSPSSEYYNVATLPQKKVPTQNSPPPNRPSSDTPPRPAAPSPHSSSNKFIVDNDIKRDILNKNLNKEKAQSTNYNTTDSETNDNGTDNSGTNNNATNNNATNNNATNNITTNNIVAYNTTTVVNNISSDTPSKIDYIEITPLFPQSQLKGKITFPSGELETSPAPPQCSSISLSDEEYSSPQPVYEKNVAHEKPLLVSKPSIRTNNNAPPPLPASSLPIMVPPPFMPCPSHSLGIKVIATTTTTTTTTTPTPTSTPTPPPPTTTTSSTVATTAAPAAVAAIENEYDTPSQIKERKILPPLQASTTSMEKVDNILNKPGKDHSDFKPILIQKYGNNVPPPTTMTLEQEYDTPTPQTRENVITPTKTNLKSNNSIEKIKKHIKSKHSNIKNSPNPSNGGHEYSVPPVGNNNNDNKNNIISNSDTTNPIKAYEEYSTPQNSSVSQVNNKTIRNSVYNNSNNDSGEANLSLHQNIGSCVSAGNKQSQADSGDYFSPQVNGPPSPHHSHGNGSPSATSITSIKNSKITSTASLSSGCNSKPPTSHPIISRTKSDPRLPTVGRNTNNPQTRNISPQLSLHFSTHQGQNIDGNSRVYKSGRFLPKTKSSPQLAFLASSPIPPLPHPVKRSESSNLLRSNNNPSHDTMATCPPIPIRRESPGGVVLPPSPELRSSDLGKPRKRTKTKSKAKNFMVRFNRTS
eukprot:Awhi_evm1s15524